MAIGLLLWGEFAEAREAASPPGLSVRAERADALYHQGEAVKFVVELRADGHPADGVEVPWQLTKDGGTMLREGRASLRQGRAIVTGTLDEPGFLQCRVVYQIGEKTWSALGAAGIDPGQIKPSLPVPDDFDAFWAAQKKQLAAIPANPRLTPVDSSVTGVEAFDLQVDSVTAPVSGYFARPKGAGPKSLPAILTLHSANGVQSSFLPVAADWAREGFLAIDMNPHGLPNGRPKDFYTRIGRGELNGFRWRGHESRESNYFRGMFLRLVRAIDFLAAQPEWDGRTLVVSGSSMGGAQAFAAAGLDGRVSFIAANMPAMSDHAGVLIGRAPVWPRYLKAPPAAKPAAAGVEAVRYYDTSNFATRTQAAALINVGFIDTSCPPTTVYAAFNSLPGTKQIVHDIMLGHVQTPEIREVMRAAIRRHVSARRSAAAPVAPADESIKWLARYEGATLPQTQGWIPVGSLAANSRIADGTLRTVDDSAAGMGGFRIAWTPDPSAEVIVEAKVRVESVVAGPRGGAGPRWGTMIYPSREGAPVGVLVSDGRHQQGLVLCAEKISTFLDRLMMMDTRNDFHTYRLVIRGTDMRIYVDGQLKIRGEGAFATPAESPEPFVQFGSNSRLWKGDARWSWVRLGLRQAPAITEKPRLRIAVGEPWEIPAAAGIRQNRPFVHHLGQGMLMMSVAQGPDAVFEPYGVLKSTDAGRTWQPVRDLQLKTFAPQTMMRLASGEVLGLSRWSLKYTHEDGVYIGMTYRFDPQAETFTMNENRIRVPAGLGPTVMFSRDLINQEDGELLASVYCATTENKRRSYLLNSADGGATWTHYSTLGNTAEPSVVRLSATQMTAILRTGDSMPFLQTWSGDAGKTWSPPVTLEEGSVDPDMVYMSNGVLACSYGRPGSNLMFSLDGGKTWRDHRVISEEKGFNYTAIREVRPGRLLYVHDAPRLRALYVDVERLE